MKIKYTIYFNQDKIRELYKDNPELSSRIWVIRKSLYEDIIADLENGFAAV